MLENEIENQGQDHASDTISQYVNQGYVTQLMEMGFSKIVAEKALFMNMSKQGDAVSNALEWISEHSEDPDFHEELKIVG